MERRCVFTVAWAWSPRCSRRPRSRTWGRARSSPPGPTRYSTTGSSRAENAHPLPFHHPQLGPGAIAHNGNLLNAEALRHQLEEEGATFDSGLDTEVMARLIEHTHGRTWEEVIRKTFARVVV